MSKLCLGVSTTNAGIANLDQLVESAGKFDEIVVCHQIFDPGLTDEFLTYSLGDARIVRMDGRGLSRSRNAILAACSDDALLVPTDDDVVLALDANVIIKSAFEKNPRADIITFKAKNTAGEDFKATYRQQGFRHTALSIRSVSSIEIVARVESLRRVGLKWDESFGLGAKYGGGLELVFLKDALDRGLGVYYEPNYIVSHPPESSGGVFDERKGYIRGAIAYRMYGWKGVGLALYTSFRHRRRIRKHTTLRKYVLSFLKGFIDFGREQFSGTSRTGSV